MKYLYNPPSLIKYIFNQYQWNSTNRKILLTFDDGPIPETTPVILDKLNKHNLKAVFFCVGENIKKHPELFKEILKENHFIGNHSYHHKKLTKLNYAEIKNEISAFNQLLNDQFKVKIKYFRPPHGKFDFKVNKVLKEENMKSIMWSLLTYDYKNDLNLVKFAVDKYLKQNSIVVLHDSLKSKDVILSSIDLILEKAGKKHYEIGEPSECLK